MRFAVFPRLCTFIDRFTLYIFSSTQRNKLKMGCDQSKPVVPDEPKRREDKEVTVEWKILPSTAEAKKKFQADGTLAKNSDPGHLELRTLLDDPTAQAALFKRAKAVMAHDIFMCWVDIQDFKNIPITQEQFQRSKALHIYHKYVKENAALEVGGIDTSERNNFRAELNAQNDEEAIDSVEAADKQTFLSLNFYDNLQIMCFQGIYHNVYLPFKQTEEYIDLTTNLQKRYNHVKLSDFFWKIR
jgi:hypothetical protein